MPLCRRLPAAILLCCLALTGCRSGIGPWHGSVLSMFTGQSPPRDLSGVAAHGVADEYEHKSFIVPVLHEARSSFIFTNDRSIDLATALYLAGVDNVAIALAEERVRGSEAEQMLAKTLLFPTLHAGANFYVHQGNLLSASGIIRDVDRESLYVGAGSGARGGSTVAVPGISVVADLGNGLYVNRIARQRVASRSFDAVATRQTTLLQVADTYLSLVGAEARERALAQSESEMAEVAKLTRDFAKEGQGREGDADRAQAERLLLTARLERAQEDTAREAAVLSQLLGADPSVRLRPATDVPPLIQLVDPDIPLDNLIQSGVRARPEIAARGADLRIEELNLRKETLKPLLPVISVGMSAGDFGGGANHLSNFGGRTDYDVLAFWTVKNLGVGNLADRRRAQAEVASADTRRVQTIDQVRREVAEAYAVTIVDRQKVVVERRRVESAHNAFEQDLTRTKNLQGRPIEVLNSVNLLTAARQELIDATIEYSRSQFQLWVSIGNEP